MADQEELRFAKTQQWYVATASITLNAATFGLTKGSSQLLEIEKFFAILFVVIVAAFGIRVLSDLQDHMRSIRQRSVSNVPWARSTDVVWWLAFIVGAVAIAVVYSILKMPVSSSPA